jgi:hypothetical protein
MKGTGVVAFSRLNQNQGTLMELKIEARQSPDVGTTFFSPPCRLYSAS